MIDTLRALTVAANSLRFNSEIDPDAAGRYEKVLTDLRDKLGRDMESNPLTLDELREMDGEPVWVQSPGVPEYGSWRIVAGVDTEDGERTLFCNGDFNCRDYGKVWLAYRRKPEKGEEHGEQS